MISIAPEKYTAKKVLQGRVIDSVHMAIYLYTLVYSITS